jgi:hypothetical protein
VTASAYVFHDGKRRRVLDTMEVLGEPVHRLELRIPGRPARAYSAPAAECMPCSRGVRFRTLRAGDVSLGFDRITGVATLKWKGRRPRAGYTATLDALYWMTAKAEGRRLADLKAIARRNKRLGK